MPTYDANRANRLIGEMDKVYLSPATTITVSLGIDLAYQLLAATQEVERLTQDISVIERDRENLCDEIERLRKLVGEACDLCGVDGAGALRYRLDKAAAIRHAAGVEGGSK